MNRREYLLQRYRDKVATEDELDELAEMVADGTSKSNGLTEEVNTIPSSIYKNIQNRMRFMLNETQDSKEEKPIKEVIPLNRNRVSGWSIAAVITALLLAVGTVLYEKYNFNSNQIALGETITTHRGTDFIVLPDSSTVVLNEGSELSYDESYGDEYRMVTLTGEAFFEVKPDAKRKFIVRSGNITTSVLGTAFNVKAFPGDRHIVVTVSRGKVKVEDEQEFLGTITPNEQIIVSDNGTCVRAKVNAERETAWTNRHIIINEERFEDVVAIISRWFKVNIIIENEALKACKITAAFLENPKLEKVLTAITLATNASYAVNEDGSITITGGSCE